MEKLGETTLGQRRLQGETINLSRMSQPTVIIRSNQDLGNMGKKIKMNQMALGGGERTTIGTIRQD